MPRGKTSTSTSTYPGDPGDPPNPRDLMAQLTEIDRQIAAHQQLSREAALTVYQPLVEEALNRIRLKAAELAVPKTALPELIEGFSPGQPVTVTMSPAQPAVVLGAQTNPQTGKKELVLLVPGRGLVAAAPEEVSPATFATPSTSTSTISSPGPLPQGPETSSSSSVSHSIHPGDLVDSPLGRGRVTAQPFPGADNYTVDVTDKGTFYFKRDELRVVPPPTVTPTPGAA